MFILRNESDRRRCLDYIRDMPLDKPMHIQIDVYKRNRTSAQNRYFHKCAGIIASFSGYSLEEVKNKIVLSVWPPVIKDVTVFIKGVKEKITLIERRKTSELDSQEFSLLLNAVMQTAHLLEIKLPMHDEIKEIMQNKEDNNG